jgi:micrococcal nuclease
MYSYKAEVVRIVDGDTVRLRVDVGFFLTFEQNFRLRGINAPEINTPAGVEAKKALTDILSSRGGYWAIQTFKIDKYGRWLVDIWWEPGTVNQMMVDRGFAVPYNP